MDRLTIKGASQLILMTNSSLNLRIRLQLNYSCKLLKMESVDE